MSSLRKKDNIFFKGIQNCSLFKHLSEVELTTISLISTIEDFNKGDSLFSQGDKGGDIYIVIEGSVDLFIREGLEKKKRIASYEKNDFLGELAFFLNDMRIGTAIANEKTSVIVINKKIYELASIFKTSGFVEFLKNIANRAGATIKEISQLMTSNKNVKLQFLNKLPKVSVEEQGIEKRRESGAKFKIGNLKNLHIFKRIDSESLQKLCKKSHMVKLDKGEVIFSENSIGKSFYIIVSGAVLIVKSFKINKENKHGKIALVPPGRPLGHLSFFDNSKRSASAIACERTTLMEIELSTYNELVNTVSEETAVAFELLQGFIDDLAVAMVNTNRALVYASSQLGLK